MPQLDPSSFASQLFWLLIAFTILYLFLANKILPQFTNIISGRKEKVNSDINAAESAKKLAEQIEAEYNNALKEAKVAAAQMLAQTAASIKQRQEEANANLDKEIALEHQKFSDELMKKRDASLKVIEDSSKQLAEDIVKKLIKI